MPNIRAEVRVRPARSSAIECDARHITVGTKTFEFDAVHRTTAQETLFEGSVRPLLQLFLAGHDCSVIAYGQTGSGKTHTIGLAPAARGAMVQRALTALFDAGIRPSCTFIEIYNEDIIDLLAPERVPLSLRAAHGRATVTGLTEHALPSLDEALRLLEHGCRARTTKCTEMNTSSSRSHAIYTLAHTIETPAGIARAEFAFVDLAGSERMKRTQCRGSTARESISINSGLLALGNVISALYARQPFVPFRDSKLTRILEHCLSSHALFIACVSPLLADAAETANTLKYAARAAKIAVDARVTILEDRERAEVLTLKKEISRLKDENNRLRTRSGCGSTSGDSRRLQESVRQLQVENRALKEELARLHGIIGNDEHSKREVQSRHSNEGEWRGDVIQNSLTDSFLSDESPAETKRAAKVALSTVKSLILNGKNEAKESHRTAPAASVNANKNETTANAQGTQRKRVVSFDLEPRSKRSLFTPRRELARVFPRLLGSAALAVAAAVPCRDGVVVALNNGAVLKEISVAALCEGRSADSYAANGILFSDIGLANLTLVSQNLFLYSVGALVKCFDGRQVLPLRAFPSPVTAMLLVSPQVLLIGHENGAVTWFDLPGATPVFSERIHCGAVLAVALLGETVYTGSRDHSIRCSRLDMANRRLLTSAQSLAPPHYDAVTCLFVSSEYLVSASRDGALKVWHAGGGEAVAFKTVPGAHSDWIRAGCAMNGGWVTGCRGGELRCWAVADESVRCVGRVVVGGVIERVVVDGSRVWVGTTKELKLYEV